MLVSRNFQFGSSARLSVYTSYWSQSASSAKREIKVDRISYHSIPIVYSRTNFPNATTQVDGRGSCWASIQRMDYLLDRTTTGIIEQLEARLQRIEYVTIGHLDKSVLNDNKRSVYVRLGDLEHGLNQLVSKSRVIQGLLKLRKLFLVWKIVSSYQWLMPFRCSLSQFFPHFRALGRFSFSGYNEQVINNPRCSEFLPSNCFTFDIR